MGRGAEALLPWERSGVALDRPHRTLQEACAFLRIPEGTLRYWRHLGAGPHSFKIGRHVRYWRTDLILWLTEQTNRPHNER